MPLYTATSPDGESHNVKAANHTRARQLFTNAIDTSKQWFVFQTENLRIPLLEPCPDLPQVFVQQFAPYLANRVELSQELTTLREGPDNPDYEQAWDTVLSNSLLRLANRMYALNYSEVNGLKGVPL